ncbi:alanine racemase [Lewinella sp. IMCC34183]|uniref:alanine racemase n=1 Tax=Lewinella sp. IMCC34183 TaxID=2248762 RepID=UPI000E26FD06|nr:alanine racemase [Lewinella sp. IMCC34183]
MHHQPDSLVFIRRLYDNYASYDLVIDSRLVGQPLRALFFALRGERRDGHAYVAPLIRLGVRDFVVSREGFTAHREAIGAAMEAVGGVPPRIHQVDRPLWVLQQLARHHRRQFDIPIVAITGSNGKTIVKDWLTEVLSHDRNVCASPRSYNSQVGVPLSLWNLNQHHDIGIFEVGISEPGDMGILADIVQPSHGILTNVLTAHQRNFEDRNHLLREKMSLFRGVDLLVLPNQEELVEAARGVLDRGQLYRWSGSGRRGIRINGNDRLVILPELPPVYLDNARSVAAFSCAFGLPLHTFISVAGGFVPLSNRLEQRRGREGGPVINDSYSNDFSALAAAVTFAEAQDPYDNLALILGTVQPLDDLADRLRALLSGRVDRLLLVGEANAAFRPVFPEATYFADVPELIRALPELRFKEQTVLVKGASREGMDQVADMLSRQLHRTTLEVDLTRMSQNFRSYKNGLPPECKVIVMAKASAYGSGALPVARRLEDVGADYLAVAYPEEGRELRQGGIRLPIMVLNAEAYSYPLLAEYDLEPVVHRTEQLRWAATLKLPVHIEVDTGMGRLGFPEAEFRQLHSGQPGLSGVQVASIFTHLAASDDPVHDAYTVKQLSDFDRLYEEYLKGGGARVQRHALNSNGISRFPQNAYDMVRLGIGLYGIGDESMRMHLQPVLTLTTTVTALQNRSAGETVGYGRRGVIDSDKRLAVLSIGYADGLPRLAGGGRFAVRIHNRYAPTIGSVCMDMCTVDVTGIPDIKVGDEAVIFSPDHPIELLAGAARTIPYEILTGIGSRVHRIYVGE